MVNVLDSRKYDPVGHCIYCGATEENLQKEHILPFGLSGTAVLPASSCSKCAEITGRQEGIVLRGSMWAVRVYRDLKSGSRHVHAPKEYPLTIRRGSVEETVKLPLDEYPILLHFPIFLPPAFLNPSGYNNGYLFSWDDVPGNDSERLLRFLRDDWGIGWAENTEIHKSADGKTIRIFNDENSAKITIDVGKEKATFKISDDRTHDLKVKKENGKLNIYHIGIRIKGIATFSFGPKPAEVARILGVTSISLTQKVEPTSFARVIAKIAYAFAAAERALDKIRGDPLVLPAILGKSDDIGCWVGTITDPLQAFNGQLHRILIHEDRQKGLLIGDVQLFCDSQTPRYGVILGLLR